MLQEQVRDAAFSLDEARENMRTARAELMARHAQIAHLAHHDPLTDLPNRTLLAAKLAEVFERAKQRGESFAVLTVDLDHFKEANDVFGHDVGDELLRAIARRLEVAADGDFLARIGGDEFTLVCSNRRPAASRRGAGEPPPAGRRRTLRGQGQSIPIGLSIGARGLSERRRRPDRATGQRRRRALSRQGERSQGRALLRSRHRPPPARPLRATDRPALRDQPQRAALALPAAGDDRRRGVRLRGAGAAGSIQTAAWCRRPNSSPWPSRTA